MDYRLSHKVSICGTAAALPCDDLPGAILSNITLCTLMEQVKKTLEEMEPPRSIEVSDPDFPYERVGVMFRRVLDEYCTSRDLAIVVANKLLKDRPDLQDIKVVVVSTVTPDRVVPNMSTGVQHALGLPNHVQAIDICVGCAGAAAALETASRLLAAYPPGSLALVVGADCMSRVLDASDRGTCMIFGDGAGSVLLRREADDSELGSSWTVRSASTYVDGSKGDLIEIRPEPELESPVFRFACHDGNPVIKPDYMSNLRVHMEGRSVYKDMIKVVPSQIMEHLEGQGLGMDDIDCWIFHQANVRMIEAIAKRMGIPDSKLRCNMDLIGNTTNGSIPILLDDELRRNDPSIRRILMVGFGTGYALGILVIERS